MEASGKYLWEAKESIKLMSLRRSTWMGEGADACGRKLEPAGIGRWGDQMDWHSVKPDGGLLFLKGLINPRNKEP